METLRLSYSNSASNLPGQFPSRDTWVYRQQEGFKRKVISDEKKTKQRPKSAFVYNDNNNNNHNNDDIDSSPFLDTNNSNNGFLPVAGKFYKNDTSNKNGHEERQLIPTSLSSPINYSRPQTASPSIGQRNSNSNSYSSNNNNDSFTKFPSPQKVTMSTLPDFVTQDKLVCRFYGYFQRARNWDPLSALGDPDIETNITRFLTIYYYIYDEKIEISEKKLANIGIKGGVFYKKNTLKYANGEPVQLIDLQVGNTIKVLGQEIHIVDADNFTRTYFQDVFGIELLPAQESPDVPRQDLGAIYATGLGKASPPKSGGQHGTKSANFEEKKEAMQKAYAFLHFDGRTFNFSCLEVPIIREFEDRKKRISVEDQVRAFEPSEIDEKFSLTFYLSDTSMEIMRGHQLVKSSEAKLLLKRARIPKNWREARRGAKPDYFSMNDFVCGTILDIYGRMFLLIGCDDFTHQAYRKIGINQITVPLKPHYVEKIVYPIPQLGDGFLAIGSPEDTLATVYGQSRPVRDQIKAQRNQNRTLRCKVKMLTSDAVLASRAFMVSFYLEDDTLQVFEEEIRNSGCSGGTFLKRGRYTNKLPPCGEEPRYFKPTDIYLGNVISFNGCEMQIVEMDNMSVRFCESYPDEFPYFDTFKIIHYITKVFEQKKVNLRAFFAAHDKNGEGMLPVEKCVSLMSDAGYINKLNDQQLLTLMRRFKESSMFIYMELCDLCSHIYALSQLHSSGKAIGKSTKGDVLKDLRNLLSSARSNSTQWRRVFRKHPITRNGKCALSSLVQIFSKHNLYLSDGSKEMIFNKYRISSKESEEFYKAYPELKKNNNNDDSHFNYKLPTNFEEPSLSSQEESPVQVAVRKRRNQLMQYVLRPPALNKGPSVKINTPLVVDDNAIINYTALCDDIYPMDWC